MCLVIAGLEALCKKHLVENLYLCQINWMLHPCAKNEVIWAPLLEVKGCKPKKHSIGHLNGIATLGRTGLSVGGAVVGPKCPGEVRSFISAQLKASYSPPPRCLVHQWSAALELTSSRIQTAVATYFGIFLCAFMSHDGSRMRGCCCVVNVCAIMCHSFPFLVFDRCVLP
jgi:hypothetical protein